MLPWLKQMQERHAFAEFVPMSAQPRRPTSSACFASSSPLPARAGLAEEDALTDRSDRFPAGEIIREAVPPDRRRTALREHVVIDKFEEEAAGWRRIAPATIVVERDAHKGMIIGEGGERLKRIGTEARQSSSS